MKTAIVHDWLPVIGGAEKVLEEIHRSFPGKIFTLMINEDAIRDTYFSICDIKTSFIDRLPFAKKKYRSYLPLFPMAVEQFNLAEYDLVISSSYAVAKGALTNPNQLHICYCHSPIRYAWDLYQQYLVGANLKKGVKGVLAKLVLHYIRLWDASTVNRVDHFVANSNYIARRIKKLYNREATVIYPPVDVNKFDYKVEKEDFYLAASRMVPYKRIDLIVEAFAMMPDKKLVVIGEGPDYDKIKSKAKNNVILLGYQPFEVLKDYMQRAKAFIFAAEEDFGIIPVEAQACGTPVIAFGKGGSLETVNNSTGIFFDQQTTTSIINAVLKFEENILKFDKYQIRLNAERFSKERFNKQLQEFVHDKYQEFKQEEVAAII
ncbi:glycosyltransferase family 4 protein [Pontibacter sp. MBLB2868]|uniref:glycosyltransferase family 4 protein n=1 Tax=Pontibacter sp. MBLB2868 TaxID=3451555 RepID=UPI003F74F856